MRGKEREYVIVTRTLKRTIYKRGEKKILVKQQPVLFEENIGNIYAKIEMPVAEKVDPPKKEAEVITPPPLPAMEEVPDVEEDAPKKKKKIELFEEEKEVDHTLAEISETINSDGYYNEMLPKDHGQVFKKKRKKIELWRIAVVFGIFILALGGMVLSVRGFMS